MTVLYILAALLIFSVIIFVHELGHFITARIFGVTVHEFAIGMGPVLWKRQGKTTLYSIRAIPMGGFCQMEGEDEDSRDEGSFRKKKPLPRIVILAAGAAMNLLLGFLVVLGLTAATAFSNGGMASTTVASLSQNTAVPFLQEGDEIVAIGENRVHIYRDLNFALSRTQGQETTVTYRRNGEEFTERFTPMQAPEGNRYMLGILRRVDKITPARILHESFFETVWMGKLVFISLGMLFEGEATVSDLSGPVGTVGAMSQVARSGWLELLFFSAFLAVNIGIMNLLPIPALDGGRILFVLIELIFRKPIPADKEGWVHFLGFALLILLMLYATYNDIVRLFY